MVRIVEIISQDRYGTAVAKVSEYMKWTQHLMVYSFASGGGILILGLGMGLAYLLFVLTGAIV